MMILKRIVPGFFISLLAFIGVFYLWGSSSTQDSNSYASIAINNSIVPTAPKDTLSIVTFNLGYLSGMTNNIAVDRSPTLFDQNLAHTIDLFHSVQPDFIAFQEIDFDSDRSFNVNQLQEITTQHPYTYAASAVNWDKTYVPFPYWPISQQFGKILSGQGLVSHYEIGSNKIIPLVKPKDNPFYYNAFYLDRLAQVSIIKVGTTELIIINVHLEAFHANTRDEQIKTVLREFHKYSETNPVILCGDFNSTPPNASMPYQEDHVISTILADYQIEMAINMEENKLNESEYFTFNSDQPTKRIDYIFYNPKFIQILDARVLTESKQISDHLPVWMKFALR